MFKRAMKIWLVVLGVGALSLLGKPPQQPATTTATATTGKTTTAAPAPKAVTVSVPGICNEGDLACRAEAERRVQREREAQQVTTYSTATPEQILREHCTNEWPQDYAMRAYCERRLREAVYSLNSRRPPNDIRSHCADE
jgi:hypothetical protein